MKVWAVPLWIFVAGAILLPIVAALDCGGRKLDTLVRDATGRYTSVWIRTRDVAPGDDMVIRVATHAGYASSISRLAVHLGELTFAIDGGEPGWGPVVHTTSSNEDDETVVMTIPANAPVGAVQLDVETELVFAAESGGGFTNDTATDHVSVPLEILAPSVRDHERLVDRGRATIAWLAANVVAFLAIRYLPRRRVRGPSELVLVGVILAMGAIAMVGQLLFVRPILRTVVWSSWAAVVGLLLAWCMALVVGGLFGLRARRAAR